MASIVDFQVHVFPAGPLSRLKSQVHRSLQRQIKQWVQPVSGSLHRIQPYLRYLPRFARSSLDRLNPVVPLPGLLLESSVDDLVEALDGSKVDRALVMPRLPFVSNDFVLETCQMNPRLLPIVELSGRHASRKVLRTYANRGAKVLSFTPQFGGRSSPQVRSQERSLIRTAEDLGIPILVKLPKRLSPEKRKAVSKFFKTYRTPHFILAHMNFHDPDQALDLCEEYPNLWVDSSWQPAEAIGEAARRIGANRVLFGSGWPFVGNNIQVGRSRIQECLDIGLLNESQSRLILGRNAAKLLGLK
jgi:hypothetical protein